MKSWCWQDAKRATSCADLDGHAGAVQSERKEALLAPHSLVAHSKLQHHTQYTITPTLLHRLLLNTSLPMFCFSTNFKVQCIFCFSFEWMNEWMNENLLYMVHKNFHTKPSMFYAVLPGFFFVLVPTSVPCILGMFSNSSNNNSNFNFNAHYVRIAPQDTHPPTFYSAWNASFICF